MSTYTNAYAGHRPGAGVHKKRGKGNEAHNRNKRKKTVDSSSLELQYLDADGNLVKTKSQGRYETDHRKIWQRSFNAGRATRMAANGSWFCLG